MPRNSIFISYSRKDTKWLEEVKTHLGSLELHHHLEVWDDTRLRKGSNWMDEIRKSIHSCRVVVLLVSSHFLASEFIAESELPRILQVARKKGVTIFILIVDHCTFHLSELKVFHTVNDPQRPLEGLKSIDRKKLLVGMATDLLEEINRQNGEMAGGAADEAERHDLFSPVVVMAVLARHGACTITDIQHLTSLRRKWVVSILDSLHENNYIERLQVEENKRPSTKWKASNVGLNMFSSFEESFANLLSTK